MPSGSRVVAAYDAAPDDTPRMGELLNFLADKLEPDDLQKVKDMLGIDDDDTSGMAGDAAMQRYHADARAMHRGGIIGDAELVRRLSERRTPVRSHVPAAKPVFPHANRLK